MHYYVQRVIYAIVASRSMTNVSKRAADNAAHSFACHVPHCRATALSGQEIHEGRKEDTEERAEDIPVLKKAEIPDPMRKRMEKVLLLFF